MLSVSFFPKTEGNQVRVYDITKRLKSHSECISNQSSCRTYKILTKPVKLLMNIRHFRGMKLSETYITREISEAK